jgi:hypothetical protein
MELPEDKMKELKALRDFVVTDVSSDAKQKVHAGRIKGMMAGLTNMRAIDKLWRLADEDKVNRTQIEAWRELRNKQVHPVALDLADVADRDYQNRFDLIHQATVLMYHVVFHLIGYEGKYTDYSTLGYPNRDYPSAIMSTKPGDKLVTSIE